MLRLANTLRQTLRARQWAHCYPLLLPHAHSLPDLPPSLRLCDGTRTLSQVASQASLHPRRLIHYHDQNLLLWPTPLASPSCLRASVPSCLSSPPSSLRRSVASSLPSPLTILLSPHPDDAALSVGGLILTQPTPHILLLDLFSRTAWTRLPAPTNPDAITSLRLTEERLAAQLMRVDLHLLNLPEALLRNHTLDDVFTASPNEQDQIVFRAIDQEISTLATQHPSAHWLLPLAVGHHLDHRLTRDAALAALTRASIPLSRIAFYEDLPYAANTPNPDFSDFLPNHRLHPTPFDITPTLRWKLELLRVYHSQFTWPQLLQLKSYARRHTPTPTERLWRLTA